MHTKKVLYLKIALSFCIFAISLRYISQIYQPTLLDDEFAYFGIAKFFAGRDWSSTISLCKYYSYGYSLLITPFAFLVEDSVLLYRLVVAMNGCFLVLAFWLLDSIFAAIARMEDWTDRQSAVVTRVCVSFLMILIPCNMNYATVALGECLLLALFLAMVKLLMVLKKDSSIWGYWGLGFLMLYAYMVHQRMLGMILACGMVLLMRLVRREVNWKQLVAWCAGLAILFIVHTWLKGMIKEELWLNGIYSGQNDMSGIMVNVRQIFSSFSYFGKFIISILGKLFYMGSSTYLFGFAGLILMLPTFKRKGQDSICFVFLSFLIGLGISAVFMNVPENMAFLLYGRYLETFTPFLMGYGILKLIEEKNDVQSYFYLLFACAVGYGLLGLGLRFFVKRWNLTWLNYISTGQLYKYLIGDAVPIIRIMAVVLATAGMLFIVLILKKYQTLARIMLGIFVFLLFYRTAYVPIQAINLPLQKMRHETSGIAEVLKEQQNMDLAESERIYYYVTEGEHIDRAQYREYVQYWLDREILTCVSETETNVWVNLPEGALVIVSCENQSELAVIKDMQVIYENEMCMVYQNDVSNKSKRE